MPYLPLTMRAPSRLAHFKREAANGKWVRPMTWRDVRFSTLSSTSDAGPGLNGKTPVWYAFSEQFPREQFADEVEGVRIDHTGWFCDDEQNEKARGIVAKLPHGRFLAGYAMEDSGQRVYFLDIHDSARDAALMADEHARVIAEDESAHSAKYDEARKLETDIEDAYARLRECLVLRHKACMAYVRDEIRELCETIRDKKGTLSGSYYADVL